MLASKLELHRCIFQHAAAEADVLITFVQATHQDTVLIGDDTDLLARL